MSVEKINILNKGIDLSDIGINNYAYSWDCIDDILMEIENLQLTILGGDVYAIGESELFLTFDSWYYNLTDTLSDCTLSIGKAREYIENYLSQNGKNFDFSFVFK